MTAFLNFLSSYAIWIYLLAVVGILFGIKMLVDSRRLARTTMFTLEQEQASDKAFRAVLLMFIFASIIGGVSVVNAFVAPALDLPTPVPVAQQTTIAFTPPVILPTATTIPTLTSSPPTVAPTLTPTRSTSQATSAAVTRVATLEPQPTQVRSPATATKPPTPAGIIYPAPALVAPVAKESISRDFIQFRWDSGDVPGQLPPGQLYRVTVQYTDRTSNQLVQLSICTSNDIQDTKNWQPLVDARGKAVDGKYAWFVFVLQVNGTVADCEAGQGKPISPPGEVRLFKWP